jgi:hypothetical protein
VFVHSVYFWLKDGLADEELETFQRGLASLTSIETVRQAFVGAPAATDRPIIDRSYSYGMILSFDDDHGHDVYQDHEVHDRFRRECSPFWSKVLIYDCTSR